MNILFAYADYPNEWNTSEWRCVIPVDAISRLEGHRASLVHIDRLSMPSPSFLPVIEWADVVVIERNFWGPIIDVVQRLKQAGKLVVADFDDNYEVMSPSNPAAPHWLKNLMRLADGTETFYQRGFIQDWKQCLAAFHAYHTPAELLTQYWLKVNPQGFTIKNRPDYNWPSWGARKTVGQVPLLVGWGGGGSHYESFKGSKILPALKQLCERYGYIQIVIIGGDRQTLELIATYVPREQLLHHPGTALEQWPSLIPQFDISFVPLFGKYDDYRSWLKVLELGAQGVPWVAADRPPYRLDPDESGKGYPGGFMTQNRVNSWTKHLSILIEDKDLREKLRKEGREWARAQSIDDHVHKRLALYEQLLKKLKAGKLDMPPVKSRPKKRRKRQRHK